MWEPCSATFSFLITSMQYWIYDLFNVKCWLLLPTTGLIDPSGLHEQLQALGFDLLIAEFLFLHSRDSLASSLPCIKYSNHKDATWTNREDEDIVDIPKIEESITAKIGHESSNLSSVTVT